MEILEKEQELQQTQNDMEETCEKAPYVDSIPETSNSWEQWGQSIYDDSEEFFEERGSQINAYHLPNLDFPKQLLKDLKLIPIWGNVLSDHFNFGRDPASSAPVESEINKLKNNFMKKQIGLLRVDQFIEQHINYIEGKSVLISAEIDKGENFSNQSIDFMICKVCGQNLLPKDISNCNTCFDFVHKLTCSSALNNERICIDCENSDQFLRKRVASLEVENWRGKGLPVSKKCSLAKKSQNVHAQTLATSYECIACKYGNFPGPDAHRCIDCDKPVHILDGCSSSIGAEEGYGEKRRCKSCSEHRLKTSTSQSLIQTHSRNKTIQDENNSIEIEKKSQTQSKKKEKKSYRQPAKYLGARTDDIADSLAWEKNKPIPIIKNGNNPHLEAVNIKNKKVSLKNTCCFDSLLYLTLIAASDFENIKSEVSSKRHN